MSEPNTTGNWRTQTPGCSPQPDPPATDLGAMSFGECYCGDPLTLDHECYHWPPKACDCEHCAKGVLVALPYLRALWQDRQSQAARLAEVEAQLRGWQDHLLRVHRTACDYPFKTELPDDYAE